jgi:predicted small lipoprotein YifL
MRLCWAQYLLWLVISIFGTGALLSSCGQKGDLYLPEESDNGKQEQPVKKN